MERNTVINVLLIIAAIVLAIALFGAGALWRGNATPRRTSLVPQVSRRVFWALTSDYEYSRRTGRPLKPCLA